MSKWQIIKLKYPLKQGCPWTVFGERDAWIAFGTFEEAKGYVWSRLAAALSPLPERMKEAAYSQGRIQNSKYLRGTSSFGLPHVG